MKTGEMRPRKMRFALIIFLVCLLLTVHLWAYYLNSYESFNTVTISNIILMMGFLFSAATGLWIRSLETRQDQLEKEINQARQKLARKSEETRMDDAASTAICWLSQVIFTDQKLVNLLESATDLIKKVLRADTVSLMLLDTNNELFIAASSGVPRHVVKTTRLKLGERIAGKVAQLKREFLLIGDLDQYPQFRGIGNDPEVGSAAVCPMICSEKLIGVLNVTRNKNRENLQEHELRHTLIFASQIAQVLWNASLSRELRGKDEELEQVYRHLRDLKRG